MIKLRNLSISVNRNAWRIKAPLGMSEGVKWVERRRVADLGEYTPSQKRATVKRRIKYDDYRYSTWDPSGTI